MKHIILFTVFTLSFITFTFSQITDQYIDQHKTHTTVIEKNPEVDDQEILRSLDLDNYEVNDVIFIKDQSQLDALMGKNVENNTNAPQVQEQVLLEEVAEVEEPKLVEAIDDVKPVRVSPERNPIGKKVKKKRRKTPRWKSDRRKNRNDLACFKF